MARLSAESKFRVCAARSSVARTRQSASGLLVISSFKSKSARNCLDAALPFPLLLFIALRPRTWVTVAAGRSDFVG
jgi:hypothetical protein